MHVKNLTSIAIWSATALALTLGDVAIVNAQVLEEITVTAQRREQNLQDVPITINTFQGDAISRQGFHTLNELSTFSPGLVIKDQSEEQGLLLRSAGTQSKNMAVEAGVPVFVDGVHMGRGSQLKGGLMDVEAVEVLYGPQPVYFGQNASAGALLMRSRRPGDTWEANAAFEMGRWGTKIYEGAFGGPITDTLGIRVAAKHYYMEGFMIDWFTGEKFPQRKSNTIRGTLQWQPTDQFQATLKMEYQYNDLGPQVNPIVLDKFSDTPKMTHPERTVLTGIASLNVPGVNTPVGQYSRLGYKYGPTFVNPRHEAQISGIPITEASTNAVGTVFDITTCQKEGGMTILPGGFETKQPWKNDACDQTDESESWPWHGILDLAYTLNNGIQISSLTAFSSQEFYNTPGNSGGGAFAVNIRSRGEEYSQWSSELRLTSPSGGQIEWMAGLYYQIHDLDYWSDRFRMDGQRPLLLVRAWDDSKWRSGFATMTYNFMDNRAAIDIGARYTDIDKNGGGYNTAAEYFVRNEISAGGDGSVIRVPFGIDVTAAGARGTASRAFLDAHPGIRNGSIVGRSEFTLNCSSLRASSMTGLNPPASSCLRHDDVEYKDTSFDPQIVLRYKFGDNISTYFKYATAYKAGGYDLAVSELPTNRADFTFGPETYKIFELGARGTFLNGRMQAGITAYTMPMEGIQVTFVSRELDRSITNNIGKQRARGVELSGRYAATENLTLNGFVALLDGRITEYNDAVCTFDEVVEGKCRTAQDSIDLVGTTRLAGTIDRSGAKARQAPNWQFTLNARYQLPKILDGYYSNVDVFFMATDDYTTNRNFSKLFSMTRHADMNLSMEIGGDDERWSITAYGRNLFAPKLTYFPEFDSAGEGIATGSDAELAMNNFSSYGIRLRYNFF